MRMFTRVAIVSDQRLDTDARALRGVFEAFDLQVDLYRMVQLRQAQTFFANPPATYEYMVIVAHGDGHTDDDMHIAFEVVDQKESKYDEWEDWEVTTYKLTPAEIAKTAQHNGGALISFACGSGREPIARAFLERGFRTFIGPSSPYYNSQSGLLFIINFFYHLLSEDRDYCTTIRSEQEAFALAAASDPGFEYGPSAYRIFTTQ